MNNLHLSRKSHERQTAILVCMKICTLDG